MNQRLLIVLALVAGLAAWMGTQGDDELLTPQKSRQGNRSHGDDHAPSAKEEAPSRARYASSGKATEQPDTWVSDALIDGVRRWHERAAGDQASTRDKRVASWASTLPPPPPAPPKPVNEPPPPPPPPPMAPRFPHAWVGRFNDESPVPVGEGASAPQPVLRAVLTGPQSTWVVRAGDVIEGQWRVDRIQDRTMSLTYLPLKQQQTVVMR